ncbi:MAG TPA: PepSY-like domain-containing protein [Isosphaeraceae bacterium]|jgi:hypothetical protein|nr:PepSY-like domain-containing protein [Isosphaeraceae bacterium]
MRIGIAMAMVMGLLAAGARADEEKVPLDKVPAAIMKTVKDRYPGAKIKEASKEVDKGKTTYEVAIEHESHALDLALKPDGTLLEIEQAMEVKDLPAKVADALKKKYPQAKLNKAEKLTAFEDGKEEVEYEVVVEEAGKKPFEVVVEPDGTIEEPEAAK